MPTLNTHDHTFFARLLINNITPLRQRSTSILTVQLLQHQVNHQPVQQNCIFYAPAGPLVKDVLLQRKPKPSLKVTIKLPEVIDQSH